MAAYNVKVREYVDGSQEVIISSSAFGLPSSKLKSKKTKVLCPDPCPVSCSPKEDQRSKDVSISRSRKNAEIIARANRWKYFLTLTFDPDKVNALSYEDASRALIKWLDIARKRHPDMQYICVLERGHKNNRWHAHLLVSHCNFKMSDSGHKCNGLRIYNLHLSEYDLGFTTLSLVRDTGAVSRYLSKYITKDLCDVPMNSKRYWHSNNLCMEDDITHKYLLDEKSKSFLTDLLEQFSFHTSNASVPYVNIDITYYHLEALLDFDDLITGFASDL